jgi:hypothetical protein
MAIELNKTAFEKLIGQLILIEENKSDIEHFLLQNKLFYSRPDIRKFFKMYMQKVESLLSDVVIINDCKDFSTLHGNRLPFLVIDSCFTLKDKCNNNHYCHLTGDIYVNASGIFKNIYAFSESGLELLMKEEKDLCSVDLGNGFGEYRINSIRMS